MLRTVLSLVVLGFATPALACNVAIIDFERAVNETTEGKEAQTRLDTMYSSRKAEIDKLRDQYEILLKDYEARALILSDAARQEAERDIIRKEQEFQAKYMQYQQEMQQTYLTLLQDLDVKMRTLTEKIAKEKNCNAVLDKAAVVYWGGTTVDLTTDLIARYNAANALP